MSKIMSTSGSHPPIVKALGAAGDGSGDGSSATVFAALFGGMQLAGAEASSDTAEAEATSAEAGFVVDPHLVQMLGAASRGRAQADAETDDTDTDEASSVLTFAGLDGDGAVLLSAEEADGLDQDRMAEAGLLSASTSPSEVSKAGFGSVQRSPLAALAEDMKQQTADAKGGQLASADTVTEGDPEFIGPPVPRALAKPEAMMAAQAKDKAEISADLSRVRAAAQAAAASSDEASLQLDTELEAMADDMVFDAAKLKADRVLDNPVRSTSSLSSSGPAQQADLQAGLNAGGSQNSFTQSGGQQSGTGSAFTGTLNADMAEQWLDVLDMQDEKWTDQLVSRIDREMRAGGNGLDLELNPRNLGRLRVNLSIAHDQTNVVLRAETGAAAQMITDAESRLAQMLDQAGLKLGQFEAFSGGQSREFGQQQGGQRQPGTNGQIAGTEPETDSKTGDTDLSDGLVNLTA